MPVPAIMIDRTSPVPLYFQVAGDLERAVDGGSLVPGERLPNEIELAETVGVSRPTMRRAMDELVSKGIVTRKRGVGTVVTASEVRRRAALTSLHEDLSAAGHHPRTDVLVLERDCRDARAAEALGLGPDAPLVHLERLRFDDDRPLALLRNWLPSRFADLDVEDLRRDGLYALLAARGARPAVARQRIGARAADARQARLLAVKRGGPVLSMERTAFDDRNTPVEFADNLYSPDGYAIEMTVSAR